MKFKVIISLANFNKFLWTLLAGGFSQPTINFVLQIKILTLLTNTEKNRKFWKHGRTGRRRRKFWVDVEIEGILRQINIFVHTNTVWGFFILWMVLLGICRFVENIYFMFLSVSILSVFLIFSVFLPWQLKKRK